MSGPSKVLSDRVAKIEGIVKAMGEAVSAMGKRVDLIFSRQNTSEIAVGEIRRDMHSLISLAGSLDRRVSAIEIVISPPPTDPEPTDPPADPAAVLLAESGRVLIDDEGNPIELDN